MTSQRVDFTGIIKAMDSKIDLEKGPSGRIDMDSSEGEGTVETGDISLNIDDVSLNDSGKTDEGDASTKGADEEQNMHAVSGPNTYESTEPKAYAIADLDVYKGNTLPEKLDCLIETHAVVMINRSWCLFSIDAQSFLVHQMRVPVHTIEVDVHPQGKEILKHLYEKHNYKSTPIIFVRGEFLGGFEEVNGLYAQGKLQDEYLKGLSQADQCELFISNNKYQMKPYFWFPEKVDGNVVRISGVLTCFASAMAASLVHWDSFFWARYLAYAIALDFFLRLLGGAKISVIGRFAMLLAIPLDPNPRMGRPKQFAVCCGITFSSLGSLCYLINFPYHDIVGAVFMGGLSIACFMEGFLDFCVGCLVFRFGIKLGIFKA